MSKISFLKVKNHEKKILKKKCFEFFFCLKFFFQNFFTFRQRTLNMGVFIRFMGSPDWDFMKMAMGEVYFLLEKTSFGGFWGRG